ncbi:thioredoxin-domain-containing protein [Thozetella sp. PMI_491]|nr:thioredoxin-domain-containing protein [Thozetella sp. PMI_491]
MHHPTLCAVAVALLSAVPGAQAGLYTKKSPVIQVDAKNYDSLIAKSNKTSIVEFYAPWCGHCQNLKPAYEKAATSLEGVAKVAAVNCDEDANKGLCGQMGVQGFPTLKIVRPKKGGGKPIVEDYQGQRTASDIVAAVKAKINNNVKRVEDKNVEEFLSNNNETAKAILFTDKGTISALLMGVAIDFLDVITVAQVRDKQKKTVELFGIDKFPTLVLLPGGEADAIVYDGELKKDAIVKFLSQAGEPNPDPAPAKGKAEKKDKKDKKDTKPKAESKAEKPAEPKAEAPPTQEAPVIVETALPIPSINTEEKLIKECLNDKSHTCVLAIVPPGEDENAKKALASLAEVAFKHSQSKRHLFPFFEVSQNNRAAAELIKTLELSSEVEIIALNARRGWWRQFAGADFGHEAVEGWIDAIRLSEGVKKKLPEGLVAISIDDGASSAAPESSSSSEAASEATQATDPTPEPETKERVHEEL